jgi:hypothetical protein
MHFLVIPRQHKAGRQLAADLAVEAMAEDERLALSMRAASAAASRSATSEYGST